MEGDAEVVAQGAVGKHAYAGIEGAGGLEAAGGREDLAAAELVAVDAGEVDGGAGAGECLGGLLAVGLEAADAGGGATGDCFEGVTDVEAAVEEGAGDDGAEAGHGEDAVDAEAGAADVAGGGGGVEGGVEGGAEVIEAGVRDGGDSNDGGAGEAGGGEQEADFFFDEVEPVGVVDEVGLGEGDDAVADVEEVEDLEVLAGLGHDAFIGGDDEEGEVDGAGAGEHVADEADVAGDVDDGDVAAGGEGAPGEAELDGEAALLLFAEAVGVGAGEGFDEGGLAVVDVAGGADGGHGQSVRVAGSHRGPGDRGALDLIGFDWTSGAGFGS